MKWPSARFFQSIGLAGFSIGVYNAVSGYSQRHKNIENVQNINKNFQQVNDAIEKIAENYSNGNPQLKAQIIEQIHKKIEIKINNTHNPLRENLDIMNNAIVDYFKIQAEITTKSFNSLLWVVIDPHTKMQLQNEILSLQSQANGKIVVIHDTISSINPNLYVAKSQPYGRRNY